jgi:4-alpha-glucanotransferase
LGITGIGDSPYQSFSIFAGNPYFIDLDRLIECGYLKEDDIRKYKLCILGRNWIWRVDGAKLDKNLSNKINKLTKLYSR